MIFKPIDLEADWAHVMAFRKDVYQLTHGHEGGFDSQAYYARMKARIGALAEGQVLIFNDSEGNNPIGQVGLNLEVYEGEPIGYVNLYYLAPPCRGRGYFKDLVAYAENFFKAKGLSQYHLRVSPTNTQALTAYKKVGMVILGQEKNSENEISLRLVKELSY